MAFPCRKSASSSYRNTTALGLLYPPSWLGSTALGRRFVCRGPSAFNGGAQLFRCSLGIRLFPYFFAPALLSHPSGTICPISLSNFSQAGGTGEEDGPYPRRRENSPTRFGPLPGTPHLFSIFLLLKYVHLARVSDAGENMKIHAGFMTAPKTWGFSFFSDCCC